MEWKFENVVRWKRRAGNKPGRRANGRIAEPLALKSGLHLLPTRSGLHCRVCLVTPFLPAMQPGPFGQYPSYKVVNANIRYYYNTDFYFWSKKSGGIFGKIVFAIRKRNDNP